MLISHIKDTLCDIFITLQHYLDGNKLENVTAIYLNSIFRVKVLSCMCQLQEHP